MEIKTTLKIMVFMSLSDSSGNMFFVTNWNPFFHVLLLTIIFRILEYLLIRNVALMSLKLKDQNSS